VGHAHRIWAGALEEARRFDEAEKVYTEALDVFDKLVIDDPATALNWHYAADTRYLISLVLSGNGRKAQALQMLRQAIQRYESRDAKFPNWREGHSQWEQASCCAQFAAWFVYLPRHEKNEVASALQQARKAVKLAPEDSAILTVLGIACYRNGDWKEALEVLKKSNDTQNTRLNADNGFFMAMTHWRLGDQAEARRCYDRAAAWMEKNDREDKRLKEFRAEAAELIGVAVAATKPTAP
jgi:tetratricopeptide (TPR) repeat protein